MSTKRTCGDCGKKFEQTFGGRPRKKCYECVPPRLNQAQQKAQRRPASTVPSHTGSSVDVEPSGASGHQRTGTVAQVIPHDSGAPAPQPCNDVHCAWCGAYTTGEPFCNPHHRRLFADRVAAAKAMRPDVRPPLRGGHPRKRPLERVRELHESQVASHHTEVRQRARERARAA